MNFTIRNTHWRWRQHQADDTYANEVEKIHAALYKKALDTLGRNIVTDYYVCSVCGYTAEGEAPDECPVCKSKKPAFHKVE